MRLYALCDQNMLDKYNITIKEYVNIAKDNNAEIIQYRYKDGEISNVKQNLLYIRELYDGKLIINDFYELVEFCDGLHLGQEDLLKINKNKEKAIRFLRENFLMEKILGLSTHNIEEITIANQLDLDYIGLGAYRTTSTKEINNLLGEKLDKLASYSSHDVAAIGGVQKNDLFEHVTYHVIGSGLL